jgi:hypothetical protein
LTVVSVAALRLRLVFDANAQRASLLGDFCNKICHKQTSCVAATNVFADDNAIASTSG